MIEAERVKAILKANLAIPALFTGGVYTREELGASGLTTTNRPEIWDGANIKPLIYIRTRPSFLTRMGLDDWQTKKSTERIGLELIIVSENSLQTLETGKDLIYQTLHNEILDSRIYIYQGDRGERISPELNGVLEYVLDYWIIRIT